jgi:hypothetical protein
MQDEEEIKSASGYAIASELEDSLGANGIHVPHGAIQQMLDQKEWIYPSERVGAILEKLDRDQLYSVFNYQHHIQASTDLFQFLAGKRKKVTVVYGHKAQGKTQFIFFVFKLYQALGKKVMFLDRTIMPSEANKKISITSEKFCGKYWRDDFLKMEDNTVKECLTQFFQDGLPTSFGELTAALCQYTDGSEKRERVWIIVDEVLMFDNFPRSTQRARSRPI